MLFLNNFIENTQKYIQYDDTSSSILLEQTAKKKYKCPYCELRIEREKLASHINKKHEDMISEEFTANRIAFNTVNKKTTGRCVQCGKETLWNENTIRYNRFCSTKCKEDYVQIAKSRMVKVYGKEHLLGDPDHQNKMLSGRRISGTYKSSRGEVFSYVGSYEKKLLEFEDIVLGLTNLDIVTPGPTIKYTFNGEDHFWITDQYIAPFNLVIDVKDGGDHPNNRDMPEYRAKQDAKEKAIRDLGTYNYIRLTDNKFEQLLSIMMDIKYSMIDNPRDVKPIIHINENVQLNISTINEYNSATNAIPNRSEVYIVPYLKNAVFADIDNDDLTIDYAISFSNVGMPFIGFNKDSFYEIPASKLKDFKMFKYNTGNNKKINKKFVPSNLLESVLGCNVYSPTKLLYDDRFEEVEPYLVSLESVTDIVYETLMNKSKLKIPVVEFNLENDDLQAYYEGNGVYIENQSGLRSKRYDSINDIDEATIKLLKRL